MLSISLHLRPLFLFLMVVIAKKCCFQRPQSSNFKIQKKNKQNPNSFKLLKTKSWDSIYICVCVRVSNICIYIHTQLKVQNVLLIIRDARVHNMQISRDQLHSLATGEWRLERRCNVKCGPCCKQITPPAVSTLRVGARNKSYANSRNKTRNGQNYQLLNNCQINSLILMVNLISRSLALCSDL